MLAPIVAIRLLSALSADGPIADLPSSNRLVSHLVTLFNQGDGNGIKALATPEFFKVIPENLLGVLVKKFHELGTFSNPEMVLDLGEERLYKLTLRHDSKPDRLVLFTLGAESDSKFYSLKIEPYRAPTTAETTEPGDNPRKSPLDNAVDAAVKRYLGHSHSIGLSLAVWDGRHEHYYNYGTTDLIRKELPTSRTIYEIGSITKTMTGILIGEGLACRKLDLNDDIRRFLPGSYPNLEVDGVAIRLRDLVTHTAGLPANPPGIPDDAKADAYEKYSHEKLLADLADVRLKQTPGLSFGYSNMGGGLAGLVLENVFRASYESLLKKYIFTPANMNDSGISLTPSMEKFYATPYDSRGIQTSRWIVNGIESAGAVRSNARDMLHYGRFNLDEKDLGVALSHKPTSPTGVSRRLGLFWLIDDSRSAGPYLDHEGGTGGFSSNITIMPSKNFAVVVLSNTGDQNPGELSYEIALRILQLKSGPHAAPRR